MRIINENIGSAAAPSAVKVKTAPRQASFAAEERNRDHAEFDRELISYARKIKSSVKAEFDTKQPVSEPSIASEEISAEIERLRSGAKKAAPTESENAPQKQDDSDSAAKTAASARPESVSAKSSGSAEAAKMLAEQKKQISKLLSENYGVLSETVVKQLEKIHGLLCEQEKTNAGSAWISEPLQKEIDKLSEIIESEKSDTEKSLSELLKAQQDRLSSLFSKKEKTDKNLMGIRNKIRQGQRLTAAERSYLSAKDFEAYESYCKINTARSMFRCSLKNCRTRDEVIGMRLSNALSALASYKKAIREGGDGSEVIALNAAFENELKSFSKSSGYRSLPTAAECDKFDRDLAKARRYEREKRLEKQRETQRLRSKRYKKTSKKIKTPGDGKRTVAQVLADPASKKVLASRAKRTYCECAPIGLSMYKTLNSRA